MGLYARSNARIALRASAINRGHCTERNPPLIEMISIHFGRNRLDGVPASILQTEDRECLNRGGVNWQNHRVATRIFLPGDGS